MRLATEYLTFFREYLRHFHDTGSISPSSPCLARAMVGELRKERPPRRILEVGPGTGSVTVEIMRCLRPGDHLDIVEVNQQFVDVLGQRFDREAVFRRRRDQARLIHGRVEELPGDGSYDSIISGLPMNNFPVGLVRLIFRTFRRLLRPGGTLTYFEYILIRHLKVPLVNRQERRRLLQVGRVVEHYIRRCQFRAENVYINLPPAVVRHLRLRK